LGGSATVTIGQVDGLQDALDAKLESAIPLTYLQLVAAVNNETLIVGQSYLITDYATKHCIDGTDLLNDNVSVEPLLVIARSIGGIFGQVYSTQSSDDIVFWDFEDNICEDVAMTPRTGRITRRINVSSNIDCPWDFRKVQVDRGGTKYLSIPSGSKNIKVGKTSEVGYTYNDIKLGENCKNISIPGDCYTFTFIDNMYALDFFGTCQIVTFTVGCDECSFHNIANYTITVSFQKIAFNMLSLFDNSLWANSISDLGVVTTVKLL